MDFGYEIVSSMEYFNHWINHINWLQTATGNWQLIWRVLHTKTENIFKFSWLTTKLDDINIVYCCYDRCFCSLSFSWRKRWLVSGGLLTFFQWNVLIRKPKRDKQKKTTKNEWMQTANTHISLRMHFSFEVWLRTL